MKKHIVTILFIIITLPAFSQRGGKIESLKVGYLTNKLNLDPKTAEKFWPLYHQYENEMMAVVQEKRMMNKNDTRNADEILDQEQKALDIKRKYNAIFSKVISGEQLNQLYAAEKDFRQIIINRAQKREMRNENNMQNNPTIYNRGADRRMESRPERPQARPQQSQPQQQAQPANRPNMPQASPRDRRMR